MFRGILSVFRSASGRPIIWLAIWGLACSPAAGQNVSADVGGESPRVQSQPSQPPLQTFEAGGDLIYILARDWEKVKDRVYATGSVDVRYKNIRLFADRVEVDTQTKDVHAEGNVVLQSEEAVVTAAAISFNLENARGKLDRVQGRFR